MTLRHAGAALLLIIAGITQIHVGEPAVDGAFRSWLPAAASTAASAWLAPILFAAAMLGFLAAGFGVLGVAPLAARWRTIALVAVACSLLIVVFFWSPFAPLVTLLNLAVLVAVLQVRDSAARVKGYVGPAIAAVVLAYVAAIHVLRPWYNVWGTSEAERQLVLPGDAITREPAHQYTRAMTVQAPAAAIWPWVVQLGQDRAGIYSYDWLERAFGLGVHNVGRIVPEWQHLAVGDLVRTAPPNWLGGLLGPNVGFRVARLAPSQALTLTSSFIDWNFVLQPVDSATTRLLIRTRVHRGTGVHYYLKSVVAYLALEPAHWIMERKMMLTLKERAESTVRGSAGNTAG